MIDGLGDGTAPSLSTFDIDIGFDPALLAFDSVTLGDPLLGNQLDILGLGGNPAVTGLSGPGVLSLFELSLDFASDLNDFQAPGFTLAVIDFDTVGTGTAPLSILINTLGDANGDPLTASVQNGSVTVVGPTTTVPAPPPALLLGAFLWFAGRRLGETGMPRWRLVSVP